ncbi:spore germination protein GerPE [Fictibacillus iocasae]|uniref:Spore germination protein GerPE n=1 Tax=Fictibacillus iocasae TaxID=2715437 RepID=A0ABW2NWB4_9BACL
MKRTSVVHSVNVKVLDSAAVVEAGDSEFINNVSYAIALQRQNSRFGSLDLPFEKYNAFTSTIPIPENISPVRKTTYNEHPFITVGNVRSTGFANSAVFHIGSTGDVRMESRALQIRNFVKMPPGAKVRGGL